MMFFIIIKKNNAFVQGFEVKVRQAQLTGSYTSMLLSENLLFLFSIVSPGQMPAL